LPNFAISSALEEKQKKYPTAIYVKDYDKVLVKEWNLADDNSDVLAFDKSGKLIFMKAGKLTPQDIQKLIGLIRENLNK
ncbi:MAG TPA: YtfJ family protein, partial [Desulfobacteria bacterium]|nr:YtfJ family protein [Desulfobacteria bacterium]